VTTISDILDRLYREFLQPAWQQPAYAALTALLDDSSTSFEINVDTLAPDEQSLLSPGVVVEVGLEQMFVLSFTNDTLTVTRGFAGTQAVAHAASSLVLLLPSYPRRSAFDAVADEIVGLYPALWALETQTFTSSHTPTDIDASAAGIAQLTWMASDTRPRSGTGYIVKNYPPSATGRAMVTEDIPEGRTVYATFKKHFTRPENETVTLSSISVDEDWVQILMFGAAARMVGYIDPSRLFRDWISEDDIGSPAGTSSALQSRMLARRDDLIEQAAKRLKQEYPAVTTFTSSFRSQART